MIDAFVADASVAIGWIHAAQATPETHALLDAVGEGAVLEVPALWPVEVANTLTVLMRRKKLTRREREMGLGWLSGLALRVDHEMSALAFSRLSELAATYDLSVYDATYLELALRRRLILGCKDGPLRKAAERVGVRRWKG